MGAAINAYIVLWNHPERFNNVLIHLGDFQFIRGICCPWEAHKRIWI